jgi:hypothetical protein
VLSFVLTLSGPAIDAPNGTTTAGSTFGVGFYDVNQNSILTNDASGFAGEVNINLDGTTTPVSFPNAANGPSVVTIQETPEPSALWLFAGILGIALCARQVTPRTPWTRLPTCRSFSNMM